MIANTLLENIKRKQFENFAPTHRVEQKLITINKLKDYYQVCKKSLRTARENSITGAQVRINWLPQPSDPSTRSGVI